MPAAQRPVFQQPVQSHPRHRVGPGEHPPSEQPELAALAGPPWTALHAGFFWPRCCSLGCSVISYRQCLLCPEPPASGRHVPISSRHLPHPVHPHVQSSLLAKSTTPATATATSLLKPPSPFPNRDATAASHHLPASLLTPLPTQLTAIFVRHEASLND